MRIQFCEVLIASGGFGADRQMIVLKMWVGITYI